MLRTVDHKIVGKLRYPIACKLPILNEDEVPWPRLANEFTPPKIDAVLLQLRTLRISCNQLKIWWPGTKLNRRTQHCHDQAGV